MRDRPPPERGAFLETLALALTQKMKKCEYCQSENAPKVSQKFACQPFFCKRQGRKPEMGPPVKSTPSLKKQIENLN